MSFSPTHHFLFLLLGSPSPLFSSPGSPFWFLSPSSPHPQRVLRGLIHNGLGLVPHKKKFCPSAPFRKTISPKTLGKKFIIFNRISLPAPARRDPSSQEIKLINALPKGREMPTKRRYNFFLSFVMKGESLKQKTYNAV